MSSPHGSRRFSGTLTKSKRMTQLKHRALNVPLEDAETMRQEIHELKDLEPTDRDVVLKLLNKRIELLTRGKPAQPQPAQKEAEPVQPQPVQPQEGAQPVQPQEGAQPLQPPPEQPPPDEEDEEAKMERWRKMERERKDAAKRREEAKRAARPVGPAPPPNPARLTPTLESNQELQSTWTNILRSPDRPNVIKDRLEEPEYWRDISTADRAELVDGVGSALQHLSQSRMPVIQSIMRVAALAMRKQETPTVLPLEIEVTGPIRVGDDVALGRANLGKVEISPYKPRKSHPVQSQREASETLIHELTHWVSFEMYGGSQGEGNPPWIVAGRLSSHRADATGENQQRQEVVTKAIETLDDLRGDVGGALTTLRGIYSYPKDVWFKELVPYAVEFLANLENDGQAEALDKVLDTGGAGLSVKQVLDQFARDLERFTQRLDTKEEYRKQGKWSTWSDFDVIGWS